MQQRTIGWLVLGILALALSTRAAPPAPPVAAPAAADREALLVPGLKWQGVSSCASTACHQRYGGSGTRGAEYTTWAEHDRHARAYQVLFDERSQRLVTNVPNLPDAPAHKQALCLSCHADNAPEGQRAEGFTQEDGIGCESCHGPAEKWRTQHYLASWKALAPAEKEALGMHQTKDLLGRIRICADCHIGSGDRDVDHDLIAAGHPRLRFEAGLYLARMPHHWDERDDKRRYPDFEARAWALGQAVAAQDSLDLLADRAEKADKQRKPWPEFAEYDCFACHHSLTTEGRPAPDNGHKIGSLVWGSWYSTMLPDLAGEVPDADRKAVEESLRRLRATMEKRAPRAATAAGEAHAASRAVGAWIPTLCHQRFDVATTRGLLDAVLHDDPTTVSVSWDRTTQHYLATAALYHGLTDLDPTWRSPDRRTAIEGLYRLVSVPNPYDSPREFRPERVREQLRLLEEHLGH